MKSEEARLGMRVRVKNGYGKPELRGMTGTVVQSFGHPDYVALDVWLEDGRLELFWHHELEETEEPSVETRPRTVFRLHR